MKRQCFSPLWNIGCLYPQSSGLSYSYDAISGEATQILTKDSLRGQSSLHNGPEITTLSCCDIVLLAFYLPVEWYKIKCTTSRRWCISFLFCFLLLWWDKGRVWPYFLGLFGQHYHNPSSSLTERTLVIRCVRYLIDKTLISAINSCSWAELPILPAWLSQPYRLQLYQALRKHTVNTIPDLGCELVRWTK